MIKKTLLLLLGICCLPALLVAQDAQDLNPTHWEFSCVKKGSIVTVTASATIDEGWEIYGTKPLVDGPNATVLGMTSPKGFKLLDSTIEVTPPIREYDKMFEMEIAYYKDHAVVKRNYKLVGENKELEGYVEFQCCNGKECIPPTQIPFKLKI